MQGAIGKGGGRRRNNDKKSEAVFSAVRATYQKGDLMNQETGAVYYRGKPRFGKNSKYKELMQTIFLAEPLRWNDQLKVYTAKVYNETQLDKAKDAHKSLDDEEKADLEKSNNEVDTSVFNFDKFKEPIITSMPINIDDNVLHAFGGMTYPWKDILTKVGYEFKSVVNGQQAQLWVGPPDIKQELIDQFLDYGFELDEYDGVDDEEEEPANEQFVDH